MSSPKFTLELTDRAVLDFRDILSYTLQTWGNDQLIRYRDLLAESLSTIAKNPQIGRDDIVPYRRYAAGKHFIFYRVNELTITIVRILHSRADFPQHLGDD
jgi:toxin ParE1/3/4